MVTSLNDIPHNTNNDINSYELNDPTIKELFKDYEMKPKKKNIIIKIKILKSKNIILMKMILDITNKK
tara:strand:+ start:2403 stop:2606 length:204 start_codon:yes stop_codon:yes gene_type:complete